VALCVQDRVAFLVLRTDRDVELPVMGQFRT